MAGIKEMVEDMTVNPVGKTINVTTEVDGMTIEQEIHPRGTHNNRCIRLNVSGMIKIGRRLNLMVLITVMLTLSRGVGTPGTAPEEIRGPVDNGNKGKEKERRRINIHMLRSPRERTGARARTRMEAITRRPEDGHLNIKMTMTIGAHGRAASFTSPIYRR